MQIRDILSSPSIYQLYQESGGFFGARLKAIAKYLPLRGDERIVDIGCGPGTISRHLPTTIQYVGYEPDEKYIRYATRRYGNIGRFVHGYFDEAALSGEQPADVVMLNGVLHHMSDSQVSHIAQLSTKFLSPGGRLFAFEPCHVAGQNPIAKWLIDNDRGEYIRDEVGYRRLIDPFYSELKVSIDHRLSRIPYTFATIVARNNT